MILYIVKSKLGKNSKKKKVFSEHILVGNKMTLNWTCRWHSFCAEARHTIQMLHITHSQRNVPIILFLIWTELQTIHPHIFIVTTWTVCVVSVLFRGMPRKIGFTVVNSSSHEDNFSAKELVVHAPTVSGWRSSRYIAVFHSLIYSWKLNISSQASSTTNSVLHRSANDSHRLQWNIMKFSVSFLLLEHCVNHILRRMCLYPQHITLQLVERSRVRKLQLLAHQYLIPAKVEFHIGDTLPESSSPGFPAQLRRLGWEQSWRLNLTQHLH